MELLSLINQQRGVQEYYFAYVVTYQIELLKKLKVFASKEKDVGW